MSDSVTELQRVHLLWHIRVIDDEEDFKMIGVYRSSEAAEAAVARLVEQPGFSDYPEGFTIEAYVLDQDHWLEGFVTVA